MIPSYHSGVRGMWECGSGDCKRISVECQADKLKLKKKIKTRTDPTGSNWQQLVPAA